MAGVRQAETAAVAYDAAEGVEGPGSAGRAGERRVKAEIGHQQRAEQRVPAFQARAAQRIGQFLPD